MVKVGIIGGSGYTGAELLRLLSVHPIAMVEAVTSRRFKGMQVGSVHKGLGKFYDLEFEDAGAREIGERSDVVFLAVPHKTAMEFVPDLMDTGVIVIDFSADYRLNPDVYEATYEVKHTDRERKAVYGLTELHREEVKDARLVANPGCFPTGAILAAAPLVMEGLVERVVFDSKTGISGAGADPTSVTHYPNVAENAVPYRINNHRHVPEIKQELNRFGDLKVHFTPHIIPSVRGILTTAHLFLKEEVSEEEIRGLYGDMYREENFVRVLGVGEIPSLAAVRGSNFCDIGGFKIEEDRVIVISAIDNLVKGASGQAIQNMNVVMGLDETMGLWTPGLPP